MVGQPENATQFDYQKSLKPEKPSNLPRFYHVDRYINRPLAGLVAKAAARTSLTPNHITVAGFFVGAAGSAFYLGGTHRGFIIAGLLIYFSTILDGADGMLARAKNLGTRYGAYLDLYLDRVLDCLVLGAMVTGYYHQSGRLGFYILSLFGLTAYMLMTVVYYIEREWKMMLTGSGAGGQHRGLVYLGILAFSLVNRLDILIAILLCVPPLNIVYRFIRFWIVQRPPERPEPRA